MAKSYFSLHISVMSNRPLISKVNVADSKTESDKSIQKQHLENQQFNHTTVLTAFSTPLRKSRQLLVVFSGVKV